jgi:hypothetical protein
MDPQFQTSRVHRTLIERLKFWRRAYQTRVFDERREAIGRGPTPEEAAEHRWVEGQPKEEAP